MRITSSAVTLFLLRILSHNDDEHRGTTTTTTTAFTTTSSFVGPSRTTGGDQAASTPTFYSNTVASSSSRWSSNDDDSEASSENILEDADGLGNRDTNIADAAVNDTIFEWSTNYKMKNKQGFEDDIVKLLDLDVETESELAASAMLDEECEIDIETGGPLDEVCVDVGFRATLKNTIGRTLQLVRLSGQSDDDDDNETDEQQLMLELDKIEDAELVQGDLLEQGWEERGNTSSLRRNAEIWKFALKCVFRVLKPRSLKKKGTATDTEIQQAQVDAATFIRDGLLTLGPTFVKLGQVISTRTDVLPKTYTDVLKTLQDDVPAFSSSKAKEIIASELNINNVDAMFTEFSDEPLKAASLGQVHTAYLRSDNGLNATKVAIKVQRAGLKELFDVDLKNLKKLAVLLDKFDPKTDGADRDWVKIYEESERLLYLEIDYLNEASNLERFAKDFQQIDYVRVPDVFRKVSTSKVLTMEYIESLKLTDIAKIDSLGLDKKMLAKQTAEAFLRQIVETSYFHCDPHPGTFL